MKKLCPAAESEFVFFLSQDLRLYSWLDIGKIFLKRSYKKFSLGQSYKGKGLDGAVWIKVMNVVNQLHILPIF